MACIDTIMEMGLEPVKCGRSDSASSVPRPVRSHPIPLPEALREDCECVIAVTKAKGYTCHVSVTATVPAKPTAVWDCLVHPDNELLFRQIDRTTYRRVLARGGAASRRLVRVDTLFSWRLGPLGGTFPTRMLQDQDMGAMVLRFEQLPGSGGGVTRLHGEWRLRAAAARPGWTDVTLEQDIALGLWAPPLVRRAVKKVAAAQVRRVMEDLQEEGIKMSEGCPTLCPYETVRDKEIGARPEGGGAKAAERAQARRLGGDGGSLDLASIYGDLQQPPSVVRCASV